MKKIYQSNKGKIDKDEDNNPVTHLQPELPLGANLHPWNRAKVVLGDNGAHLLTASTCEPFAPVTRGVALGRGHLGFFFAVLQLLSGFHNLSVIILAQWTKPAKHYYTSMLLHVAYIQGLSNI